MAQDMLKELGVQLNRRNKVITKSNNSGLKYKNAFQS